MPDQTVNVRPVSLDVSDAAVAALQSTLASDELARADAFRVPHPRRCFIVARGVLRTLLGEHLEVAPREVRFEYGARGKPRVDPAGIQFNVSHSGNLALLAFTVGCELGVDIEQVRRVYDMHDIAERFFCREEAEELKSLPGDQRERAFFHCWTRKEAFIKATGEGLSLPLDSFRVSMRPGEPARMFGGEAVLHDLTVHPQYAAALAYQGGERPVVLHPCLHWRS